MFNIAFGTNFHNATNNFGSASGVRTQLIID